jgi:hypothetical protein
MAENMVSMKLSAKEAKAEVSPSAMKAPEYPWGLRLRLDEEALKKLGIKDLPAVESTGEIYAKCYVSSASSSDSEGGGQHRSLELQITDLSLTPDKKTNAAKKIYGE